MPNKRNESTWQGKEAKVACMTWDKVRLMVLEDLRNNGRDVPLQCEFPDAEKRTEKLREDAGLPPLVYVVEWKTAEDSALSRLQFKKYAEAVEFFNTKYYNSYWTSFRYYELKGSGGGVPC